MLGVGLLASGFNNKLNIFIFRFKDSFIFVVDALVTPSDQFNLICAILSLKHLIYMIKMEGIMVILITLTWIIENWHLDIRLLVGSLQALPDQLNLLFHGPVCHPVSLASLVKPRS